MVAVIKTGTSIRRTFHYNENKVKEGVAECFMAQNYPLDVSEMSENMRLNMLLKTAERNPDVVRNSVHISLNFAPDESFSKEQLSAIATEYMEQIGFGKQPYLVYQHFDAGHPHIHIATTKIRPDGTKIDMNNIGRNQSEKARKAIEVKYNLVKAEDHKGKVFRLPPIDASIVQYGRPVTKRAITTVLDAVLERYAYTSLPELNAVLNLYNVSAERGSEGTRTYNSGGLVYRVLDANGRPVSAPIKASVFYSKPTLAYLEKRFVIGKSERSKHAARIKNRIDLALIGGRKPTLAVLSAVLKKDGIATVFRYSEAGHLYGITYVDHKNKCVFNGRDLGPTYSAKAITERCAVTLVPQKQGAMVNPSPPSDQLRPGSNATNSPSQNIPTTPSDHSEKSLLEHLTQAENTGNYMPYELSGKKKDKKKRRSIKH